MMEDIITIFNSREAIALRNFITFIDFFVFCVLIIIVFREGWK
ncbi:hypothetical protein JGUZn3_20610 [Entomobacter blattae]|uniref:Uncharacterized protein n=1 Tax=Entomobacter blattae TaxID=2762277 RepID=A0A7H1NU06_9PROT|nr:hypothetical protein JGUZn3_20610 [Entomobacter blattae]